MNMNEKDFQLYNLNAEQDILGAILFDNNAINYFSDFLRSQYFYEPFHQKVYETAEKLIEKGRVADPVSLENHFYAELQERKNSTYLVDIAKNFAVAGLGILNLTERGRIIYDLYIKRKMMSIMHESQVSILEQNMLNKAESHIEKLEARLFVLANEAENHTGQGFISLEKSVENSILQIKKAKEFGVSGIATGFWDLDHFLSGWHNSDLVVIAARPSMGKTAFAISIALNAAKYIEANQKTEEDKGVIAVFSLEMSAEQLATRIISIYSGFDTSDLSGGKIDKNDLAQIVSTAEDFAKLPIYIDDTPAISINAVRTRCRRLKRQQGLRMIVIDYLQLLKSNSSSRYDNRVQEITEITQGLKAIAKELNVPVLALSQLSRSVESREDKRPQLQDLRESGSIEQDADIVMFIYREAYYLERTKPNGNDVDAMNDWNAKNGEKWTNVRNKAEIIIGKHRNGPIGSATLRFEDGTTKFDNLAQSRPENSY